MTPTIQEIEEYGDESYSWMDWGAAVFVLYLGNTDAPYDENEAVPASFFAGTKIRTVADDGAAWFEYESEAEEALEYYENTRPS